MEMTPANAQNASEGRNEVVVGIMRQTRCLLLDFVGAAEHAVDAGEVVGAGNDGVNASLGGEVLLEVSLLTEVAHLVGMLVGCSVAI